MFRKIYLEPAHHRKHRGCVQISSVCVHYARETYRIMRKGGVDKWDARTCVFLLLHGGRLTQKYIDATPYTPKEAVGAF